MKSKIISLTDMGIYLRGSWYRYKKQINGHTYHRALKVKRGQESLLSGRLKQIEDEITALHFGLPLPASAKGLYLSDLVDQYLAVKRDLQSHAQYRRQFKAIMEIVGDHSLNFYVQYNWRKLEDALFDKELAPATIDHYMGILRAAFAFAVRKRILSINPLAEYEYHVSDSTARPLADDEIKKILDGLRAVRDLARPLETVRKMLYDLVLFGLLTGARLSEIINLRHSYIEGDIAWIPTTITKHRRRVRTPRPPRRKPILLSVAALDIIHRQDRSKDDPDFIFPLSQREHGAISNAILRIRKDLGVPDFHFHLLRHTFASRISTMTDPGTARILLGHANIQTTMIYAHSEITSGRQAVAKLGTEILIPSIIN